MVHISPYGKKMLFVAFPNSPKKCVILPEWNNYEYLGELYDPSDANVLFESLIHAAY